MEACCPPKDGAASNVDRGDPAKERAAGRVCKEGRRYVERQLASGPKTAVLACEGACVKGEVARTAANLLAYRLERDRAVRICLGDATTASSGFAELVTGAPRAVAVEGCRLRCATELLKAHLPGVAVTAIDASALYTFDRERCFEILDMPREELDAHAAAVAERVRADHFGPAR
jgi:uncharacterized metal-binding protein